MIKTPVGAPPLEPGSPHAAVDWRARWLKDPVFAGVEPAIKLHPGRSEDLRSEIINVHTLLRKRFVLPKPIASARVFVTADDTYKLYLNDAFVGLGPAPSYHFDYFYNGYDVSGLLTPGDNVLAAHVFYQGMHSLTFTSGDHLSGFMLQLEVEFADGETMHIVSDDSWRCRTTDAHEARQALGYQTAFSEHIDLRRWPHDWTRVDFDDSDWVSPHVEPAVPELYELSPQPTPPVAVYRTPAASVIRKGDGHYFIDFGCELAGESAFVVTGPAGHEVEVRHGEELEAPQTVRWKMRCNCDYQEFCTLSGRADELLTFFDYKGFRYVEVLNWPDELTIDRVWAHERHYPFADDSSAFDSGDELLNRIWQLCRNGVRVGTVDVYLDCPTREKGGFLGDAFVTGISHLLLTGDARILRKFLKDVANTSRYCKGLFSTAPNYVRGILAEYSMLWPVLVEYYYRWTGDDAFVREMMPTLGGLIEYFEAYENADGLLADVYDPETGRYSILIDWPENLRDDYDDIGMNARPERRTPGAGVVNTNMQGFFVYMLRAAERLADAVDDREIKAKIDGKADRAIAAARRTLLDVNTGRFVDRNGSTHSALHASVGPLLSGMVPAEHRDQAIAVIREKRLSCGVYYAWFVLKALYEQGEADLAYDLMTSKDLHSWHSMLEAGATTCMEAWAPDLKWNTSWCHPWSSAPIHMLTQEMLGLSPATPGWGTIAFEPQTPAALPRASARITIPQGALSAGFERAGDVITYRITMPAGCTAACAFVETGRAISVDGEPVEGTAVTGARGHSRTALPQPLCPGEHEIVIG